MWRGEWKVREKGLFFVLCGAVFKIMDQVFGVKIRREEALFVMGCVWDTAETLVGYVWGWEAASQQTYHISCHLQYTG